MPRLLRGYRPLRPGPDSFDQRADRVRLRSRMVALVLACLTLMTLDHHPGAGSPLEPARTRDGLGLRAGRVRHVAGGPAGHRGRRLVHLAKLHAARHRDPRVAELPAEGRSRPPSQYQRNQLAEYQGLTSAAATLGQALVPAHVVAYGPAQSFSRTVTIDAGSEAGVQPDQTVLNDDGLVGRVLRVTRTTATVLLIVDTESVVGGRVGA